MEQRFARVISSLPATGLLVIENPSEDHPDNALYYQMERKGILVVKGTEESGIIAIGLTSYGKRLKKDLQAMLNG